MLHEVVLSTVQLCDVSSLASLWEVMLSEQSIEFLVALDGLHCGT